MKKWLAWLKLPEVHNIPKEDTRCVSLAQAAVIRKKPFLKRIYTDFYQQFKKAIPGDLNSKLLVELGSGGGFIKEIIPTAVTSDILDLPEIDQRFSALDMPFQNNSVDAFFVLDVLHHIHDPRTLFKELDRCLKVGGKAVMIEPANTLWSRFIYRHFHHELFDCSKGWGSEATGPLNLANIAIPWIIFYRDRSIFEREFPALDIVRLEPHTPLRYLISGGVSMRQLLPSFTYNIVKAIEIIFSPFNKYLGMFLTIELTKNKR
ncbi:MAG: class I SAM-dependent methyltransferase [Candidatus Omnitrophota bacterium]